MATLKAANVTKYDAGGSGDNYIADGYIKSVEKVWIDSYTIGTGAIGSDDTIKIATIPANKKITDVKVFLPAVMAGTTAATILVGSASTMDVAAGNVFLGALRADGNDTTTVDAATGGTLSLQGDKIATVTPEALSLYLKIVLTGGTDTDTTGSTLKINSIVKYT